LCLTYTADPTKFDSLRDYFRNVDTVVHLARVRFPYTRTVSTLQPRSGSLAISPVMLVDSVKASPWLQCVRGGAGGWCQEDRLRVEPGDIRLLLSDDGAGAGLFAGG
jgi:hypothetical protein